MLTDKIFFGFRNRFRHYKTISNFYAVLELLNESSYLQTAGWFESVSRNMSCDKDGQALPWYTYAAIDFLEARIRKEMKVFEFGSGNSTLWWNCRVAKVVSCEHDESWFQLMKQKEVENTELIFCNSISDGEYSKSALNYSETFDVIIIDGRDRVNCAMNSIQALKPDGVIIWDNSNRQRYQAGYEYLMNSHDFKCLNFSGIGPMNHYGWRTSVFYRSSNCLGI